VTEQGAAPDRLQLRLSLVPRYSLRFRRRVSLVLCCGARRFGVSYFQMMKYKVPQINAEELQAFVEAALPHAEVTLSCIDPQFHSESWCLGIRAANLWYEYTWEPLSGFRFTDVNAALKENYRYNSFAPYVIPLFSMEEAKQCLREKIENAV